MRTDSLDGSDAELFAELCDSGVLSTGVGISRIEVMWLAQGQSDALEELIAEFYESNRERTRILYREFQDVVARYAPPNVRSQIPLVAKLPVLEIAMFVLNTLCRSGYLTEPNDDERKRIMILLQGQNRLRA